MDVLEMRALRYRNKGQRMDYDDKLYYDALDETGTVSTAGLSDSESDLEYEESQYKQPISITEQLEMMEYRGVSHEVLQMHVRRGSRQEARWLLKTPYGESKWAQHKHERQRETR